MKHVKHKKIRNTDKESLYLLSPDSKRSCSLDVGEVGLEMGTTGGRSSSLQIPTRYTRKRRGSSMSRDFGQLTLSWRDLSVSMEISVRRDRWRKPLCCFTSEIKDRKVILENVSGAAFHGELSFLMGSSGAGKTTLLSALCNRNIAAGMETSGRVELQGVAASYTIDTIAGFVPQFSYLVACLTVWEHVWFHASLRASDCRKAEEIEAKVNSILKKLDLLHLGNNLIGEAHEGLSGGEKKRLSLATELLADPPLLFVDEPTSGLDSVSAYTVMKVFKNLAKDGRAIMVSIHQPSSNIFELCDRLTVLHEGRTVYHGPSSSILGFLEEIRAPCPQYHNLAEHILEVARRRRENKAYEMKRYFEVDNEISGIGKLSQRDKISGITSLIDALAISGSFTTRSISPWTRLRCVLWRGLIFTKRNKVLGRGRIIQSVFMALSLAVCFFQLPDTDEGAVSRVGALAVALLVHTTIQAFLFMRVCVSNKKIFQREESLRMYSATVLWISQNLAELPACLFTSISFTTFVYFAIGLNTQPSRYLTTVGAFVACVLSAMGYGIAVAAAADTFTGAQLINMICVFTILFVGGPFSNAKAVPVYMRWVQYLSWLYQAHEACVITQFDSDWHPHGECGGGNETCTLQNGDDVLDLYGFTRQGYLTRNFGLLGIQIIMYRLLGWAILKLKERKR